MGVDPSSPGRLPWDLANVRTPCKIFLASRPPPFLLPGAELLLSTCVCVCVSWGGGGKPMAMFLAYCTLGGNLWC